jgi:hypothetical protein
MNPNWRDHLKPWKPGESGNPAGRPKGSRNKINQAYVINPSSCQRQTSMAETAL